MHILLIIIAKRATGAHNNRFRGGNGYEYQIYSFSNLNIIAWPALSPEFQQYYRNLQWRNAVVVYGILDTVTVM